MSGREKNIIDFSTHLFADLNKKLLQEQKEKYKLICALRDLKSFQRKVIKDISAIVICDDLDELLSIIFNQLSQSFACDVVRLGIESDLISQYESYYPENNYSGLSFVPTGCCAIIFADKTHLIIDDNNFKQVIFSDCNDLAQSSLHLRLRLPHHKRDAVLAFGAKHPCFFNKKKYDFELLNLLAQVVEITVDKLLGREVDYAICD